MTPAQARVLRAVHEITQSTGTCPTYQDVANSVGLASLSTVHKHIVGLVKDGMIEQPESGYRKMRLTKRGLMAVNRNNVPSWVSYADVIEDALARAITPRIMARFKIPEEEALLASIDITHGAIEVAGIIVKESEKGRI